MNTKLLERLDARLREFISTEEVPYGGGLMGDGYDKPQYPSLHLSRSTDAGLMKLPGEGSAMVRYRVKSRNIDESRDDGQPLYGASIEIQSLEPVSEGAELEETVFLKEFSWAEQVKKYGRPLVEKGKSSFAKAKQSRRILKKLDLRKAQASALGAGKAPEFSPEYNGLIKRVWDKADTRAARVVPNIHTRRKHSAYLLEERLREFGSGGQASMRRTMKSLLKKGDAAGGKALKKRVLRQGDGALARASGKGYGYDRSIFNKIVAGKVSEGRAWDKINKSYALEETVFLKEFAVKPRTVTALMKTSKRNPLKIAKDGFGEFKVYPKGKPNHKGTYFTPDIADARGTAADLLKRKRAGQNVGFEERHFAEARDRDGEGRFAAGGIPGPRDYAIAGAVAKRKKAAVGAGVGVGALAGGAALMRSGRGRQVFEGVRSRLVK